MFFRLFSHIFCELSIFVVSHMTLTNNNLVWAFSCRTTIHQLCFSRQNPKLKTFDIYPQSHRCFSNAPNFKSIKINNNWIQINNNPLRINWTNFKPINSKVSAKFLVLFYFPCSTAAFFQSALKFVFFSKCFLVLLLV